MASQKQICHVCGVEMSLYEIYNEETGEKVGEELACPNEWKESHHVVYGT